MSAIEAAAVTATVWLIGVVLIDHIVDDMRHAWSIVVSTMTATVWLIGVVLIDHIVDDMRHAWSIVVSTIPPSAV